MAEDHGPLRTAARDALDHAPIGTLHAFARRLLFEFPVEAGLPPGFDVLDELESQLALDERWEDLQDELLDDATREVAPGLRATELVVLCGWGSFGGLRGLRSMVEDFQANWDLVDERVDLEPPARPGPTWPAARRGRRRWSATPVPPGDRQEAPRRHGRGRPRRACGPPATGSATIPPLEDLKKATAKPFRTGAQANWKRARGRRPRRPAPARVRALPSWPRPRWRRGASTGGSSPAPSRAASCSTAPAARGRAGTLEFHDLLVLARRVLTRSAAARRILHDRYQRVLLDEFQDTDPIQLEIAILLTSPPESPPSTAAPGAGPALRGR